MKIQEESVKVISVIAGFNSYKAVLIEAGIIAPLIRVLESGSYLGKEKAARTLHILTENSNNAWSVSAHGGVTALLKICTNGDDRGELIGPACGVLRNLSGVEEIKRFMVEGGAISAFIKLMKSKDEDSQINSIEFLKIMASGDEAIRHLFIRSGGIHSLIHVLDPNSPFSSKAREIAIQAIESFGFSSTSSLKILLGSGFLELLLFFIRNGEVSIQEVAVKATYHLSGASDELKKAMGDVGFMPELVRLLDAKSFEIREMAAEALSNMVSVQRNKRRFLQEDCNVGHILKLLDPEEGKSVKHHGFLPFHLTSVTGTIKLRRASSVAFLFPDSSVSLSSSFFCDNSEAPWIFALPSHLRYRHYKAPTSFIAAPSSSLPPSPSSSPMPTTPIAAGTLSSVL
ncbi:hypothetical protein HHK36_005439 [Tetracentron sinense]|uniref:Uncharacterized protein n=1 Tax=Tetracentron sinense TaxID=13715 RepID=A0A834ZKP8_TETSI|nr:hypothetical protein HHK36_005439 [Tetracentron sinense]